MSIESINLELLGTHLDASAEIVNAMAGDGADLLSDETAVKDGCPGKAVDSPAVPMLRTLLESWIVNDQNARAIHRALGGVQGPLLDGQISARSSFLADEGIGGIGIGRTGGTPDDMAEFIEGLQFTTNASGEPLSDAEIAELVATEFPTLQQDGWIDDYERLIQADFDPVMAALLATDFGGGEWVLDSEGQADLLGRLSPGLNPWHSAWQGENTDLPAAFYYESGGFITGSNGMQFPLVVPTFQNQWGEGRWANGFTYGNGLDELDPGWVTLDVQRGIIDGYHENGDWVSASSAGAFFAGTNPNNPGVDAMPAEFYLALAPDINGYPSLPGPVEGSNDLGPVRLPNLTGPQGYQNTTYGPNGNFGPPPLQLGGWRQQWAAPSLVRWGGAAALLAAVTDGVANVADLHSTDVAGFQVITEANPDGRTRARVQVFEAGGSFIVPSTLRVDAAGDVHFMPMVFREPYAWHQDVPPNELPEGIYVYGEELPLDD